MKAWSILPALIFIILVIFFGRGLMLGSSKELPSVQIGKSLPVFKLPLLKVEHDELLYSIEEDKKNDLEDNSSKEMQDKSDILFFTPHLFEGKISLLNVWASWCASCEEEQKFLMHLAKKGIHLYGLNYKDKPEEALEWVSRWGNPYQAIGLDLSGTLSLDLGVYGTPETFLIDSEGIIRLRHAGVLNEKVWNETFLPLIQRLGVS